MAKTQWQPFALFFARAPVFGVVFGRMSRELGGGRSDHMQQLPDLTPFPPLIVAGQDQ
jgi:hypothetical protein